MSVASVFGAKSNYFGANMEDKQLEEALAASLEKSFNDSELEDIMNEIENLEREFSEDASAPKAESNLSLDKAKDNNLQKVIDDEVASINSEIDTTVMETQVEAQAEAEEESFDAEDFDNMADESDEMIASQNQDEFDTEETSAAQMSDETIEITDASDYEDEMQAMEETIAADVQNEEESNVFAISTPKTSRSATLAPAATTSDSAVEFAASGTMNLNINLTIAGQAANLVIDNGSLKVTLNGVELTIDEANGCCVTMAQGVQFSVPLNMNANANNKKSA